MKEALNNWGAWFVKRWLAATIFATILFLVFGKWGLLGFLVGMAMSGNLEL